METCGSCSGTRGRTRTAPRSAPSATTRKLRFAFHEQCYTKSWYTKKFSNPIVRAVDDFVATRVDGVGNDYRPPDATTTGREKLLIWGRPGFAGAQSNHRSAKLYFAYVDLPSYGATGSFAWAPRYYTGMVNGVPQFSSNQTLAKALDLSGLSDGLPTADTEKWDINNQMSIAFVTVLDKWVMFYGGTVNPFLADLFSGGQGSQVQFDPEGAIHVRWTVADDPWGPRVWPEPLLKGGDPNVSPPLAGTQYAPSGILHHAGCVGATCAPHEPAYLAGTSEDGSLYAPNIIEQWTEDRGPYVDLYWNVSTWNPIRSC